MLEAIPVYIKIVIREQVGVTGWADRQIETDGRTETDTDRQIDRQKDRQTDRQTATDSLPGRPVLRS